MHCLSNEILFADSKCFRAGKDGGNPAKPPTLQMKKWELGVMRLSVSPQPLPWISARDKLYVVAVSNP